MQLSDTKTRKSAESRIFVSLPMIRRWRFTRRKAPSSSLWQPGPLPDVVESGYDTGTSTFNIKGKKNRILRRITIEFSSREISPQSPNLTTHRKAQQLLMHR